MYLEHYFKAINQEIMFSETNLGGEQALERTFQACTQG